MSTGNDALWEQFKTDPAALNRAHADRAHDTYRTGATGTPVQADQDAREAMDGAHTVVTNANMGANLNSDDNAQGIPSYTGGNVVTVAANRAGVDLFPEDSSAVEDLEQEVIVENALQAGTLFDKGGQMPPDNYVNEASASPYVDGLWLAEASKQTGEKFF